MARTYDPTIYAPGIYDAAEQAGAVLFDLEVVQGAALQSELAVGVVVGLEVAAGIDVDLELVT